VERRGSGDQDDRPGELAVGEAAVVRPASAEDVNAIATIEQITRGGDVGEWVERLRADLRHPARWLFAALHLDSVIGFGRVALLDEAVDGPGGFYLGGVTVDPTQRRQGVGTALTTHRLAWIWERAELAWCVVNARNAASLRMHERLGFIEVRRCSRIQGVEFDGGVGVLLRAERP
jgi:ribosomal protein S18 acetylase RimI-like enzyme